jgi:predicted alpha/beta-fold hydrolase
MFATHAHIDETQLMKVKQRCVLSITITHSAMLQSQFLREFDEQFTRRVWGYKSVDDYYDGA